MNEKEAIQKRLDAITLDFLTIQEVVFLFDMKSVYYKKIHRDIQLGILDASQVGGEWRIPKAGLYKYIEKL